MFVANLHLAVGLVAAGVGSWCVTPSSVLLEDTVVVLAECWAAELSGDWSQVLKNQSSGCRNIVHTALQLKWDGLLLRLEEEAAEVVTLEESLSVVCTASQVGNVNTSVSLHEVSLAR